jgi:hypothetical protein
LTKGGATGRCGAVTESPGTNPKTNLEATYRGVKSILKFIPDAVISGAGVRIGGSHHKWYQSQVFELELMEQVEGEGEARGRARGRGRGRGRMVHRPVDDDCEKR